MDHYSGYVELNTNYHTVEIKRIRNFSDKNNSSIYKYFDYSFNIISYPTSLYRMSDIDEFKDKEWATRENNYSFSSHRSNNISILPFWSINIYYVGKRS